MKPLKKILKGLMLLFLLPLFYFIVSLVLSFISIERKIKNPIATKSIYLNTNGVHLDIIIPKKDIDSLLLAGIRNNEGDLYFSFGWGDENFYLNTPTWGDLNPFNAFNALFFESPTLIHLTRYQNIGSDWTEIKVTANELNKLNFYLLNSFKTDENGNKILLKNKAYSWNDDFYKAKGNYSFLKTCNTWVNSGFKESGLKSCLWTPFDFGLLQKYSTN